MKLSASALFLLLLASPAHPARADDEAPSHTLAFDGVNVPLEKLLEKATVEKKLVFLDFYLPG